MFSKLKAIFIKEGIPLKTESLIFKYKDREVLSNLNIKINESKIVVIIGKSGSGKSTFLKLVTGVIGKNFKGNITIMGKKRLFSKKDIGYVPQEISLIPDLSIEENIKIFGGIAGLSEKESIEAGKELLSQLHLDESLSKNPNELSGGQRVRLNIIVSMLHDPAVVILDEPFVGLDFFNRRLLWHFFEGLKKKKKSIILTTHLLSEIEEHAEQILVLNRGKIEVSGTSEEIKQKLKANKVMEVRFDKTLTDEKILDIREYCRKKTVKMIDYYNNIAMFSIESENQKKNLEVFLNKNKMKHHVLNYKIPSLDEAFMRAE